MAWDLSQPFSLQGARSLQGKHLAECLLQRLWVISRAVLMGGLFFLWDRGDVKKRHPTLDAHEIAPRLWQGSVPPMGGAVRDGGFNLLVLCAREHQYPSVYFHNVAVVNAPNDDNPEYGPLTREKLKTALQAARRVVKAVKAGQAVLVTCAAGLNRSGLVSALSLHLLYGWSGDQCIKQVRARRPAKKGINSLSNTEFTTALRRLPAFKLNKS